MKFSKIILFIPLITLVVSCGKNKVEPITATPTIELIEIVPASMEVQQYNDNLIFTISYTDGDGDLGTENPDIPSIELIDTRNPNDLKFEYHLSPRSPSGSEVSITGELNVILEHSIIINDLNDSEETTFKIRIKDRAGNWSNEVESEKVTITK